MIETIDPFLDGDWDESDPRNICFSEELPSFLEFTGNRGVAMPEVRTIRVCDRVYAFRGVVTFPERYKGMIVFSKNLMFGYDPHLHFVNPQLVKSTETCPLPVYG